MEICIGQKKGHFRDNLPENKRWKEACEKAKINLTKKKSTPTILEEYQAKMNLEISIDQEKFDITYIKYLCPFHLNEKN